ncbi:ABC transporter ATP-binding protein [Roseibacillus persicicus]|uniref:ABC transporter ATP-binding protein n=1 Tax=Roseibacillus persicicus TaxID=454148 RepID=A0A918TVX8_9BACT|nr:ABC transporter ATP-binding protein [Roseibacillus persicicus]MDQ8189878.1 ABC transporter ATP-binding protein [Roseibacillus persicicus]GHC62565.1 ABC transporter ATP-binding protein [Roseibacillus persicicus]
MSKGLLEIHDLVTSFKTDSGWVRAVDKVSFSVDAGKSVGLVGESGCGKTVTAMSIVDLLPKPSGHVLEGEILLKGEDLRTVSDSRLRKVRGGEVGVIFQEPMTALNPVHRIGKQLVEVIRLHKRIGARKALQVAIEWLEKVGIPDPASRVMAYPHQLSGGMRQRVMIAMALCCEPELVIADEPTTALDVTVQAQILELLEQMRRDLGMSVLLITHDLGVIAEQCEEVVVMYAGRVVEKGAVEDVFKNPAHAYTKGLLNSIPRLENERKSELNTIPGQVASIADFVSGCRFCQRMGRRSTMIHRRPPYVEIADGHWVEACRECYEG